MTIADNERVAARWVDVWNRRDLDAFDDLYAPPFSITAASEHAAGNRG